MRRITAPLVGLALATMLAVPALASPFPNTIDLPDGWQPEGITSDGTTLYVGSLVDGAIWRGSLQSGTGDTFIPGDAGQMAVGIDFDAEHGRIWVAGGGGSSVRVYDATTGELLETYTFESGFVNDIVATENAVYATDSNIQQLLVVPLGPGGSLPAPDDAFTLPLTGDISYVENAFNANGIAWARGKLVIVQSVTGLVFTVDSDGVASQVELRDGSDEYLVTNGDGIEIRGSTLAVVQNFDNLVATFKLNGSLTSGLLTNKIESDDFAVPTTATWAAGDLWVVNARFDVQPPPPDLAYWVSRVPGL